MESVTRCFSFGFLLVGLLRPTAVTAFTDPAHPKIRIVTWNVADNGDMGGSFLVNAIDAVLGLYQGTTVQEMPDIYAIGLQEQCWECNVNAMVKIAERFLERIQIVAQDYEVVGVEGTRESSVCELGCSLVGTHGTTALVVIARRGLVTSHASFHRNDGCSSAHFIENDEKGVAYMTMSLAAGKKVCVAASHLESKSARTRRYCLKEFFSDANNNEMVRWSASCDFQFVFGDFNTRTGDEISGPSTGIHVAPGTDLSSLKTRDEFLGSQPYGTAPDWRGNLLAFINSVQTATFKEGPFDFMPTYSVRKAKDNCQGNFPCYRSNRPKSWTDRIIFTEGRLLKYDAILEEYGDHFPVFAEFRL